MSLINIHILTAQQARSFSFRLCNQSNQPGERHVINIYNLNRYRSRICRFSLRKIDRSSRPTANELRLKQQNFIKLLWGWISEGYNFMFISLLSKFGRPFWYMRAEDCVIALHICTGWGGFLSTICSLLALHTQPTHAVCWKQSSLIRVSKQRKTKSYTKLIFYLFIY